MGDSNPNEIDKDVVIVTSRPHEAGARSFRMEAGAEVDVPALPPDLRHEARMVEWLREAGLRLTMVGGGSRPDEVRRFYFRQGGEPGA